MAFGENLHKLRKIYKLSQEDVASAINLKRSDIAAVEKGDRVLNDEELGKLVDFIGIDIVDLLSQENFDYKKYRETIIEALRRYTGYTGKSVNKTLLAELIYLADSAWYYEHLQSMSGVRYRRLQYGSVSDQYFQIVDELINEGKILLKVINEVQWLSLTQSIQDVSLQYLSTSELELIDKIIRKWKDSNIEKIVSFIRTQLPWQICRDNEYIPYELITQEEPNHIY